MVDPLERPAASYMNRGFVQVDGETSVARAVEGMQAKRAEVIIVLDNGAPVGIATDSDILDQVVIKGEDSDSVPLRKVMSSPIVTISPNTAVKEALRLMRVNAIKRIPVHDSDGSIIGLVTQKALADAIRTSVIERTFREYRSSIRARYKPILANLGFVLQFAGILMVAPAFLGTLLGETGPVAAIYLTVVGLFGTGFVMSAFGEKGPLSLKESSIIVVAGFVLLSVFGSIPYMFVNPFQTAGDPVRLFVNSLFESASGFTTTGLSAITTPESLSQGFNFYRSYTQWVGGLSFVYLVMLLFYPERKLSSMRGLLGSGALQFKQLLVTVSVIFTTYAVILTIVFYVLGQRDIVRDASFIMSAITGGGFVPNSLFLSLSNAQHLFVLMAAMIISALPFAFHYSLYSKTLRTRMLGVEVFVYFVLLGTSSYIMIALTGLDWITASFHTVSASTNTGFQFLDLGAASLQVKALLIIVMLVGGCAYSAAGGIKIGRFLILLQKAAAGRKRKKKKRDEELSELIAFTPFESQSSRTAELRYNSRRHEAQVDKVIALSDSKIVKGSLLVIALFASMALLTGYALSYLDDRPLVDATFEAVSALTTTGLSIGMTSVDLDLVPKSILIVNMIVGKFEIIVLLYIFSDAVRRQVS
ncbi:MAG: CBS domain-containing protein [Nitrososphaera sp.]|nr:CBS domain-containing protein [Nitrososphaera sp.]